MLKNIIRIQDNMIINTSYEINEKNITILNGTERFVIEKDTIKRIEHCKNNAIRIIMNRFDKKILYTNCIENYSEFYEKLNKLHEIQEYRNKTINILIRIFGGILLISMLGLQ
jgi:hypothetical protein